MTYVVRPLTPEARSRLGRPVKADYCPFTAKWNQTLTLIDRELWHVGVRGDWVLQLDVNERDLRNDGMMRANARPPGSDVAIAVKSKSKGDLLFVCARFWDWQDNVRAIALGLEALRKVERYGIVQSNEQYRGWQALPPGMPMPAAQMTVETAAAFIAQFSDDPEGRLADVTADPYFATALFKEAAKRLHPDAGGDPAMFRKLTEARDVLVEASAA